MMKRVIFSLDDLSMALHAFARYIGEPEHGGIVTAIEEDEDKDFCALRFESLTQEKQWKSCAKDVIGAALVHYQEQRNYPLPQGKKKLIITGNSEIIIEFEHDDGIC